MATYIVELPHEIYRKVESDLDPGSLLTKLREDYMASDNVFSTFTPHRNRIPIAVYSLQAKDHNNESVSDN